VRSPPPGTPVDRQCLQQLFSQPCIWPLWVGAGMPAVLARCHWGPASCSSWSLQPICWGVAADMLGRLALAAHLAWYLGVVAPQDVVMTRRRRGCFVRAQLPMMNVHDFRHGMFNKIHLSHGASHMCSHHRNRGPGGIPGRIHGLLKGCGVEFGWLAPALQHVQVVTRLQVVFGGS
jgi:hypothetical protein